jgi:YggT family protein
MFIIANLLFAIAKLVDLVISIYIFVVIVRVVLSWLPHDPYNSMIRFVYTITEPILTRIRAFIPPIGGFDLSSMILIILLYFAEGFIVSTLTDLAMKMK